MRTLAQVGILLDQHAAHDSWSNNKNVFGAFVSEVLGHGGITYTWLHSMQEVNTARPDVVIVAAEPDSTNGIEMNLLWSYIENGGSLISFAGLNTFATKLGFHNESSFGPGYASLSESLGDTRPLRFIQATPWVSLTHDTTVSSYTSDSLGILRETTDPQNPILGAALHSFSIGKGTLYRWAVDLPATWVGLQQGTRPVTQDGIPAPDGTGAIDDQLLKADDSFELDWNLDRTQTETGFAYFQHPYSDLWKEAFIGHVLQTVLKLGLTLPFIGYWPNGVEQVAMISLDSDQNKDETAVTTLKVLKECDVQTTWCMIEPGYSPYIYELALADGHELAFHYNAMEDQNGIWGEEEFVRQFAWLKQATGLQQFPSNKNHYTRFEGWGEIFQWCERYGIQSDQTRGPSKKGNVGFLFGTCHPYFPIAYWDEHNRTYDVLEIGFLTQDVDYSLLTDSSVVVPFLEQSKRVQGVAHFLFHQVRIHNEPMVADAVRKVVRIAREYNFTFMTGEEINNWERARRSLTLAGLSATGEAIVTHSLPTKLNQEAVVWIPVAETETSHSNQTTEYKFGVLCRKQIIEL